MPAAASPGGIWRGAEASGEFDFSEAVDAVISAYRRDGLVVQVEVLDRARVGQKASRTRSAQFAGSPRLVR